MASHFASLWIRGLWQLFHNEKNEKKKENEEMIVAGNAIYAIA